MSKSLCALRVDDHGLEAWHLHGGECDRVAGFAAGKVVEFSHWLARQPRGQRCRLVVDLADEDVQLESVPRARGADRRALIARRFATHFGSSPITWLRAHGRHPDQPHLEQVLMYGLTRPTALEPWLNALRHSRVRLEAVCSAALLTGHFAPRALRLDGPLLLAVFGRTGMRLSHIDGSGLRFSRLVPGISQASGDWLHEIGRTRDYLVTQRATGQGAPLRTVLLAASPGPASTTDLVVPGCPRPDLEFMEPALLLPPTRGTPDRGNGSIDTALVGWLAHAPRRLYCRTPSAPPLALPVRRQVAAYGGAAGLLAVGVAIAALRWTDAAALDRDTAALEERTSRLRRELAQIEATHATLPAPPEALLDAVEQLDREQAAHAPAGPVFTLVSSALDATAGVELDRLSWRRAHDAGTPAPIAVELHLRLDETDGLPPAAARLDHFLRWLERQGARAVDSDGTLRATRPSGAERPAASASRIRFQFDGVTQP